MKKFSKNYLYYHLFADFFAVLVCALAFSDAILLENEAEEVIGLRYSALPYFAVGFLLVYGLCILYQVLYLHFASYTVAEKELRVTRGVLLRKNTVLDFSRVHAVNKKQNIIQRLFGLAVITVDSGSANTSMSAEAVIYESSAEADRLLSLLKAKRNGDAPQTAAEASEAPKALAPKGGDLAFTSGKKLVYSLLNIAVAAFSLVAVGFLALATYFCILPVLSGLLFFGTFEFLLPALKIFLIALIGLSGLTFLGSLLQGFVGYYGFRIVKGEKDIEISYGLFMRHTNTFGYDRIQGAVIRQGLIQRIFGYATLQLEVIGYHEGGNDQNEGTAVGVLLPLVGIREAETVLADLLPAYTPLPKERTALRYFPFISWSSLFITAGYALAAFFVFFIMHLLEASAEALAIARILALLLYAVSMGVHLLGACLSYKNAGLSVSSDRITLYSGGYVRRVTTVLRRSLVAVEDITTPMRDRADIHTVVLHIRANAATNEIKVGMLNRAAVLALQDALRD